MTHIGRINALVLGEQLGQLTETELKVWLVFHQHANDATGIAYPSTATVARLIGHKDRKRARQAIDALAKKGFLELACAATFTAPAHYRVRLPAIPPTEGQADPQGAELPPLGQVDQSAKLTTPGQTALPTGGQICPPPGGQIDPPNREENRELNSEETRAPKRRRRAGADSELVLIPSQLAGETFGAAWREWQEHRRDLRKPLTPTSTRMQLDELATMGSERAIAAIRHSIARGWQGIFEADRSQPVRLPLNSNGRSHGPDAQRQAKIARECPQTRPIQPASVVY